MNWSKYNHLFIRDGKCFLYNSLSNCFIELSEHYYDKCKNVENSGVIEDFSVEFRDLLIKKKAIVDSDEDELNNLILMQNQRVFDTTSMGLTIAPTQLCNFACSYCYEDFRVNKSIDKQTCENLITFIKSYKELKDLNVTWYGGEPLIAINTIRDLSKEFLNLDLNYSATIITNGYLLSKEILEDFITFKINKIQITIDGLEETHNARRPLASGNGSFAAIIHNLITFMGDKYDEKIQLVIRVNIDKSNQSEFSKLKQFLEEKFPNKRYKIYSAWTEYDENHKNISLCTSKNEQGKYILDSYLKDNIKHHPFFPSNNSVICMTKHIASFLLGPEGYMYKCWHDLGNNKLSIFNINDSKFRNPTILSRYMIGADILNQPKCKNCTFLPMCFSSYCPKQIYQNKYENKEKNWCTLFKMNLETFLFEHYKLKVMESQVQ